MGGGSSSIVYSTVQVGFDEVDSALVGVDPNTQFVVKYLTSDLPTTAKETFVMPVFYIDLTNKYSEKIVEGSVRFGFAGKTFVDRSGNLYTDIDPATGSGTLAGTINYTTGLCEVSSAVAGSVNSVTMQSLLTEYGNEPCDYLTFRIPSCPVRTGSFQLRGSRVDGTTFNVQAGTDGLIDNDGVLGKVDYVSGIVELRFGSMVVAAGNESEYWYRAEAVTLSGKVFKPRPVYIDSLLYNAVAYSYMPLNADILGLDPVRLPPDGKVVIYRPGDIAVVHNTQTKEVASPTPGLVVDCGRVRLSSVRVKDASGALISDDRYTVNLDAGTVTFASNFLLGTNTTPFKIEHRIEDMALVSDVQLNGVITMTRTLTHNYPIENTKVSSALIVGDIQARVDNSVFFSQTSWTSVWSDTLIGTETTSQYNKTISPVIVTNKGAVQERWALIFDSSSTFRIVGENVGQIGTGNINSKCAPMNPATGAPYFTLNSEGWGSGWAAGYTLRFNTKACNYPIWIARTVLQGAATVLDGDGFSFQIRGDIDHP